MQKGRIAGADCYAKFSDEGVFDRERGDQAENAPRDEGRGIVNAFRVSGSATEILPPVLKIGKQNSNIKREPDGVEDVLHADTVRSEAKYCMQHLPGEVQCQRIERNGVRLVPEAYADAFNVDYGPADTADDCEDEFYRIELHLFQSVAGATDFSP